MDHGSCWASTRVPAFAALEGDRQADVVIIGGGMTGVVSAYLLAKAGKRVAVVEKGEVGRGTTVLTTAMLSCILDTRLSDLARIFGDHATTLAWQSHQTAIDMLDRIASAEGIACDFIRSSTFLFASDKAQFPMLEREHATASRLGIRTILHKSGDIGVRHHGYLEVPNQAKLHPMRFFSGLVARTAELGVKFFEHTEVQSLQQGPDGLWNAKTPHGSISAKHAIVATYNPFNRPGATRFKKGVYTSYVLEADIPKGALPEVTAFDVANPYHYLRIDPGTQSHDRIIFGGEDHRQELKLNEERQFGALTEHMKAIIGDVPFTVTKRWTGPILESIDGLALIGRVQKHQYVATGFSGNGITYSTIAGLMFRDFIIEGGSPWHDLYDPKRRPTLKGLIIKTRDYVGTFFGGAVRNLLHRK